VLCSSRRQATATKRREAKKKGAGCSAAAIKRVIARPFYQKRQKGWACSAQGGFIFCSWTKGAREHGTINI